MAYFRIWTLCFISDIFRPNKNSEDLVVFDPTIFILTSANLPLLTVRYNILKPKFSIYRQVLRIATNNINIGIMQLRNMRYTL